MSKKKVPKPDIVQQLYSATYDKDNFPRIGTEICVSAGLAIKAAEEITSLRDRLDDLMYNPPCCCGKCY